MSRPDPAPFEAPWQAHAFALTHALADAGLIDWSRWADTLSAHLHAPDAAQDGSDYYRRWLATLEQILQEDGIAPPDLVNDLTTAWEDAARATPHGTPIPPPHLLDLQ